MVRSSLKNLLTNEQKSRAPPPSPAEPAVPRTPPGPPALPKNWMAPEHASAEAMKYSFDLQDALRKEKIARKEAEERAKLKPPPPPPEKQTYAEWRAGHKYGPGYEKPSREGSRKKSREAEAQHTTPAALKALANMRKGGAKNTLPPIPGMRAGAGAEETGATVGLTQEEMLVAQKNSFLNTSNFMRRAKTAASAQHHDFADEENNALDNLVGASAEVNNTLRTQGTTINIAEKIDEDVDVMRSAEKHVASIAQICGANAGKDGVAAKLLRNPLGTMLQKFVDEEDDRLQIWVSNEENMQVHWCTEGWMKRFGFSNKDEVVGWYLWEILGTEETAAFNEKHGFTHEYEAEVRRLEAIANRLNGFKEWTSIRNANGTLCGKAQCVNVKNRHTVQHCKRFELLNHPAVRGAVPMVNRFSILPWSCTGEEDGTTRITGWVVEFFDKERSSSAMEHALKSFHAHLKDEKVWINADGTVAEVTDAWCDRWGFKDSTEVLGFNIHDLMNNGATHNFNKEWGFQDVFDKAIKEMNRDSVYRSAKAGKVKIHIENITKLASAPRFELLQCPNYTKSLRKCTEPHVNRFSTQPYITGRDGQVIQFVCECFAEETISDQMEYALLEGSIQCA